jgi:hypothetical protein
MNGAQRRPLKLTALAGTDLQPTLNSTTGEPHTKLEFGNLMMMMTKLLFFTPYSASHCRAGPPVPFWARFQKGPKLHFSLRKSI